MPAGSGAWHSRKMGGSWPAVGWIGPYDCGTWAVGNARQFWRGIGAESGMWHSRVMDDCSPARASTGPCGCGSRTAAPAFFPIDPITAAPNASTTHGMLHGLASIIGVPGLSIAAILISRSLARNPAWSEARRSLFWAANLTWISLLLMILTLAIMLPLAGKFGPNVWIGWPNRIVMIAYSRWLITVAWRALQLSTPRSG
jgi:hypothetical protein